MQKMPWLKRAKAGNITITLKDSGGGIDNDVITKVFEPYFTTKHKSKGTGLGLYIAYTIITQHFKGTISVRNAVYDYKGHKLRGAEFVIVIPNSLSHSSSSGQEDQ